ncbi:hypothetical protein AWV80_12455 [Cupriavidus sp. UYMU48A]|nr:hypothetical protein AWV80_12455 [Cupriavidus sp. UYMU48A]
MSTMRWPHPRRSKISSVRLAKQMARDPVDSVQSSSTSTTRTPRWARSMAVARPMGPAPTTTTGWTVPPACPPRCSAQGWYSNDRRW